jgi:hypothetical protein
LLYMPKVSATPGDVDGAFEQFAFVEDCACPDEGHQVLGVDGPPAGLCCINELVGHGNTGCTGAGSFGDFVRNRTVANVNSIGLVVRR